MDIASTLRGKLISFIYKTITSSEYFKYEIDIAALRDYIVFINEHGPYNKQSMYSIC